MRRTILWLALICVAPLGLVLAEPEVGEAAPPLEIASWIEAPEGETLADLKGRVVLVLGNGAGSPADANAVQRWNDLRAAWWEDGLRIVALLPEASDASVDAVEYSLAVGTAPAWAEATTALVGADGKVAWTGDPKDVDDEMLAGFLRRAKSGSKVTDRVAENVAYWTRQAERAERQGNPAEALVCLARIQKHRKDTPEAVAATERSKALKADRAIKREVSAAGKYARFREELARARGSEKKIAALVKKLERFVEKEDGTRSAERAGRLLEALRADPAIAALQAFIAKERIATKGPMWKTQLPKPPQVEFSKAKDYYWVLETNMGTMKLKFFPDIAPMHVSSTIYLTTLGFYDGLTFHRVIPSFMAQGGCPTGDGRGNPGYKYAGEFAPTAKHDRAGILSMANAGVNTDGSQFFIMFRPDPGLDGKHSVFGELVEGQDTLQKIRKAGTESGRTTEKVIIEKATVSVE